MSQPLRWAPPGERRAWSVERFDGPLSARLGHRIAAHGVRPVVDGLLRTRFDVRIENGPAPRRSVVVSRHVSYWDPALIALVDVRIKPLGNEEWFRHGLIGWYARNLRALPNDLAGLRRALIHLRRDGIVWMAPAGYTAFERRPPRPGAWRLACLADASLVAVTIDGLDDIPLLMPPKQVRRRRVTIRFGAAHELSSSMPAAERELAWRAVLRDAGVPDDCAPDSGCVCA
ncbi:MAG: lysophospholipid acyltransferase family protein [Tepidisphaeraceae bacterium]